MRRKKILLIGLTIYILLIYIILFSTPYMISWGNSKTWFIKSVEFIQDTPFKLVDKDGEIMLAQTFINALFWTGSTIFVYSLISRYRHKKW